MKILISPGYGAGWSTWNTPEMAFNKNLIDLFESGCTREEMHDACLKLGYEADMGGPFLGGFGQLEVRHIPKGKLFKIREYDGSEYVEIFDPNEWYVAAD